MLPQVLTWFPVADHALLREHLREHGQVRSQRGAEPPGARSSGHQHPRSAHLFLIRAHRPPVTMPFQRHDLPVAQETGSVAPGEPQGREHGVLAAHVTALRIEQRDVAVADDMLGQAPSRLFPGHDFEAQPPLPARSQQRGMIRVIVIHDGHHAGDMEQAGLAGCLQLTPQIAGTLQQRRVMPALGIHHPEHPGLTPHTRKTVPES